MPARRTSSPWLKSRWREENFLKYASQNYGTGKICDYLASIETNTKIVDNPARKAAIAAVREAEKALAGAERELAALLTDPAITPAVKNASIPALQDNIARARQAVTAATAARKDIPAKLPASDIDPGAKVALLRTGRRGLQMVLRLLACNAERTAFAGDRSLERQAFLLPDSCSLTSTCAAASTRAPRSSGVSAAEEPRGCAQGYRGVGGEHGQARPGAALAHGASPGCSRESS